MPCVLNNTPKVSYPCVVSIILRARSPDIPSLLECTPKYTKVDDMEEEMGKLSEHMQEIGALSDGITSTLSVKRTRIKKLTESHMLLKKLQFLFELPSRLKKCLERKAYVSTLFSAICRCQVGMWP